MWQGEQFTSDAIMWQGEQLTSTVMVEDCNFLTLTICTRGGVLKLSKCLAELGEWKITPIKNLPHNMPLRGTECRTSIQTYYLIFAVACTSDIWTCSSCSIRMSLWPWTTYLTQHLLSQKSPRKNHLQRPFHLLAIGLEWKGDSTSVSEDTCPDLMYKLQKTMDKCFRSISVRHVSSELNVQTSSLNAKIPVVDNDHIISPSNPPPVDSPILALL